MGLFAPAWKSRNVGRAVAYVERCGDPATLSRIFWEAEPDEVRMAALNRITDQNTLLFIASSSSAGRFAGDAADRLKDENLLLQLAAGTQKEELGKKALARIADPELLFRAARTASLTSVRAKAASRVDQPGQLFEIAGNDSSAEVRCIAVKRLEDQDMLASVARKDTSVSVRREALSRIRDRDVRLGIAAEDPDERIRAEAAAERGDQVALGGFALGSRDAGIRKWAAERLEDQEVLERAARNDADAGVREAARKRILDPEIRTELGMKDGDPEERWGIIRRLPPDSGMLLDAALNDPDLTNALLAAERMEDPAMIREAAMKSGREKVTAVAVRKMKTREELLSCMGRGAAAELALERLRTLGLLDAEESRETDLELLDRFFRERLEAEHREDLLEAYERESAEWLEEHPCEESVTAAILLLRKNPVVLDSYYRQPVVSAKAHEMYSLLSGFYRNHPELRSGICAANRYSIDTHLDHGGPSCHEDSGGLKIDFKEK